MKILVGLGLAILAMAVVKVIAAPNWVAEPGPISVKNWCLHPSQGCRTRNHTVHATAEALSIPESQTRSDKSISRVCLLHGHGCYQVKRPVKSTSRTLDIFAVIGGPVNTEVGKPDNKRPAGNNNLSPSMFLLLSLEMSSNWL